MSKNAEICWGFLGKFSPPFPFFLVSNIVVITGAAKAILKVGVKGQVLTSLNQSQPAYPRHLVMYEKQLLLKPLVFKFSVTDSPKHS